MNLHALAVAFLFVAEQKNYPPRGQCAHGIVRTQERDARSRASLAPLLPCSLVPPVPLSLCPRLYHAPCFPPYHQTSPAPAVS
jgi:hypothetical protein